MLTFKAKGTIRVVNARVDMAPDSQPEADEVVIPVDRSNPSLGNKHVLRNKYDRHERDRVIDAYARDLDADFAIKGPMYYAVVEIAQRVGRGEKVCLQCHCRPLRCHAEVIAGKAESLLKTWQESRLEDCEAFGCGDSYRVDEAPREGGV